MLYEEKEMAASKSHNLIMEDRAHLSVSGVLDVESFDDRQIIAKTSKGNLIIRGSELHIDKLSLDSGELVVTGLFTDLGYEETAIGGSLWSKLFR